MDCLASVGRGIDSWVIEPACNMGSTAYHLGSDLALSVDHGIEGVTDAIFPHAVALVAHQLIRSLPITVAYICAGLPIRVGLWAAYTIVHLVSWALKRDFFGGALSHYIHRSLGVAAAIEVLIDIYKIFAGLVVKDTVTDLAIHTTAAVVAILMSYTYFNGSNQFVERKEKEVLQID